MAKRQRKHKTSRLWTGDYEKTTHVFDGDSKFPTLSRCGKAEFDQMTDQIDSGCDTLIEFMTRYAPADTCANCRMSMCFEIWRTAKGKK